MGIIGASALTGRQPQPTDFEKDVPLELWGGLCTELAPGDCPQGASPANQDVDYEIGGVFTRAGLTALFDGQVVGSIVYMKSTILRDGTNQLLVLDSAGNLYYEDTDNSPGTLVAITTFVPTQNQGYPQSFSQFGKEWIAFGDGQVGLNIPMQWDGTNLDRVSQDGPGAGPSTIADVLVNVISLSRVGGITTVVTSPVHGLIVGQLVTISGASDVSFDGTYPVNSVSGPNTFSYYNSFSAIAIQSISAIAGTVTVNLAQPLAATGPFVVGGSFVADGEFSGTVVSPTQLTYLDAVPDAASSQGTVYYLIQTFTPLPVSFINVSGTNFANVRMRNPLPGGQVFVVNEQVTISGTGVTGIDGVQTITLVLNLSPGENQIDFQFHTPATEQSITIGTVSFQLPDATATGGIAAGGGLISPGDHKVSVAFLTRSGYITRPSPPIMWTAIGGLKAQITGIPIGPPNVVARILLFTASGGDFFFYIPFPIAETPTSGGSPTGTVINDNTSTTFVVDFSDDALLASISGDAPGQDLFALVPLKESAGVRAYGERMLWWGTLNAVENLLNMSFDGGYIGTLPFTTPLGWTADPTVGGGTLDTSPAVWGFSYGAFCLATSPSTTVGTISQSAYQDYNMIPILLPNTQYSIRGRLKFGGINVSQTAALVATLSSASTAYSSSVTLTVGRNGGFNIVSGILGTTPAVIPSDMRLSIQFHFNAGFTPSNAIFADELSVYPTAQPVLFSDIRASYIDNPESFDGGTGLIGVSAVNTEAVRNCKQLRENLYIQKEHSSFYTQVNGQTEPDGWSVGTISLTIGSVSVNSAVDGEEWFVSVDQNGLYIFNGSEPIKISQEIQPNWDNINWKFENSIWMVNDIANRRVFIGIPTGAATQPDTILMMNYRELNEGYMLSQQGPIHISFTGKLISWDMSRKWSPWSISADCGTIAARPFNQTEIIFGNNLNTNKAYILDDAATTDDGAMIPWSYNTFFFLNRDLEESLQMGMHRKLYKYMTLFASGGGNMAMFCVSDSLTSPRIKTLPNRLLTANPGNDRELILNWTGDRTSFQFASGGTGSYFKLQNKLVITMQQDPHIPIRGIG